MWSPAQTKFHVSAKSLLKHGTLFAGRFARRHPTVALVGLECLAAPFFPVAVPVAFGTAALRMLTSAIIVSFTKPGTSLDGRLGTTALFGVATLFSSLYVDPSTGIVGVIRSGQRDIETKINDCKTGETYASQQPYIAKSWWSWNKSPRTLMVQGTVTDCQGPAENVQSGFDRESYMRVAYQITYPDGRPPEKFDSPYHVLPSYLNSPTPPKGYEHTDVLYWSLPKPARQPR